MTKRKCKNVDISDAEFIRDAVNRAMERKVHQKGKRIYKRQDVREYFQQHDHSIDNIVEELRSEILNRELVLEPVFYKDVIDKNNGKQRRLCVEHIKQQFYDYIAALALDELSSYIGVNQTACKPRMGQQFSARLVYRWLNTEDIKYCIKADIRKCYQSITHENILAWLRKHVKNEPLLWLIEKLLDTCEEGLPIGSYLSIKLCALYVADLYHHIEGGYLYQKRGETVNAVNKVLIYLDDIFIFGSNATQMKKVIKGATAYAESMGLTIKPDWRLLSLSPKDPNAHVDVVGYKVYRDRITTRRSNYLRLRQTVRDFKREPTNVTYARSLTARLGLFLKYTNSRRFVCKYRTTKLSKRARKVVSNYDKSIVRQRAAGCNPNG